MGFILQLRDSKCTGRWTILKETCNLGKFVKFVIGAGVNMHEIMFLEPLYSSFVCSALLSFQLKVS
jgi:hypothetical protein